jgi:adenosylcobinamide kinase / adenosylcobinamide-phosphate guanylyltransferase
MTVTFVLGGARSGKSAYAQALVEAAAARALRPPVMIATAQACDQDMAARIARHRRVRGTAWRTIEAPLELAAAIRTLQPGEAAAVDCLTLWLSNLMHAEYNLAAATDELLATLAATDAEVAVVSNEVGMSVVPENALARTFRDAAGLLHQRVAQQANHAVVMFCGLAVPLKGEPARILPQHLSASE